MTPIIESIIPAILIAAISGYIAFKVGIAKMEEKVAAIMTRLDKNDHTTETLNISVAKRDEEMRGVHDAIKTLQGSTQSNTDAIRKLELQLTRIETILTRVEEKIDKIERK